MDLPRLGTFPASDLSPRTPVIINRLLYLLSLLIRGIGYRGRPVNCAHLAQNDLLKLSLTQCLPCSTSLFCCCCCCCCCSFLFFFSFTSSSFSSSKVVPPTQFFACLVSLCVRYTPPQRTGQQVVYLSVPIGLIHVGLLFVLRNQFPCQRTMQRTMQCDPILALTTWAVRHKKTRH